jgi:NDP-sugar pyrophosphorylase family protein
VITNLDLGRLWRKHHDKRGIMTFASYEVNNPHECGIIESRDDRIIALVEKPKSLIGRQANAGIIISEKSVFAPPNGDFDICRDTVPRLTDLPLFHEGLIEGEWLYDVGTRTNFDLCERRLNDHM